jgi:HK97 family phage prohead protease
MSMTEIETTIAPKAPVEIRSAVVTDVSFPQRIIELLAVPYDEWAWVEHHGKMIEEAFEPGAFGQIQNRASRFLVNLEHDPNRIVGRCQALHPDRPEGLISELRIRRGPEGDQVLTDAEDQMVGGSVGFAALPENIHWETRSRRKVMKAFLDHIALTFSPAYLSAVPLDVRSSTSPIVPVATTIERVPTPNLDMILAERLAKQYGL